MINDKYLAPISQAEKSQFFEKIFRELHIAPVDSENVHKVAPKDTIWLRQRISRHFANYHCTSYVIGRYVIVWKGYSTEPIFLAELEEPFDIFSLGECNFLLRQFTSDGQCLFTYYCWDKTTGTYQVTEYEPSVEPDEYRRISEFKYNRPVVKHQWNRIYPHHDEETQSVDNRIFYDFIVKYWEY